MIARKDPQRDTATRGRGNAKLLLLGLMALSWLAVLGGPMTATAAAREVTIGVLAKRGAEKVLQKWNPTAAYLSERIPRHRFRIIPVLFDEAPLIVRNELVDFVILNSAIYVDLSVKYGVRRISTLNNRLSSDLQVTEFGSVIFSAAGGGGDVKALDAAVGKHVAAVHETSLGGWIMALREFRDAGISPDDFAALDFLETHDAVVEAVMSGKTDVGIVRTDTLERMASEGRIDPKAFTLLNPRDDPKFPFLLSTRLYPEWPIAQLAETEADLAKAVAVALMQMERHSKAAEAARITGWAIPENYQPVHEILRDLALSPYEWTGRVSLRATMETYWPWMLGALILFTALLLLLVRIVRFEPVPAAPGAGTADGRRAIPRLVRSGRRRHGPGDA